MWFLTLEKLVTDIPTIFKTTTTNDISTVTFNYPVMSKIRYVMVYEAKNGANLDLNDPSQIIDKIAFKEKKDTINIVITKEY